MKLISGAGFAIESTQVHLKSYQGNQVEAYSKAITNLWKIFTSKEAEFFGLTPNSDEWTAAQAEVKEISNNDFLSEGYVSLVGVKK